MRAAVTGSAGFVGRHMVQALRGRGWTVLQRDVAEGRDCLDYFARVTERLDLVVHAAARAPHRSAIDHQPATHVYNQFLDAAMFDWAVRTGTRVLYLSSCAVLDETPDDYGLLKLAGERMARQCGVPVTVVRPYSGYGEDQGEDWPFGAFVARAKRREDPFVIWGDGSQVRDWIHIDDVVNGALALAEHDVRGPVSLCTGVGTSMVDLARMVCEAAGYSPRFELRSDRPAGSAYRVGDPTVLHEYYKPRVDLAEGVARAL